MGSWMAGTLSIIAFLSPIIMVILPKMNVVGFKESQMICNVECDGLLISFSFKLFVLTLGTWALFFRQPKVCLIYIYIYNNISFEYNLECTNAYVWKFITNYQHFQATLPRIYLFRTCVCLLLFVIIFAFWLFYGVRVLDGRGGEGQAVISAAHRKVQYIDVVHYASSMLDSLLFVHYLAILLIELRHTTNTQ